MRWIVFAGALHLAGCAFQVAPCQSDDDCPPETRCVRPPSTGAPVCIAPDEVADMAGDDMTEQPDRDTTRPDLGEANNTSNIDTPLNNNDDNNTGTCDPVTYCGALEPNDTEDDAIFLTDFAEGCSGFGVDNWSTLHQDSLCAGDVDQFIVEYVPCDEGAFRITASLTTPQACGDVGELEIAEGRWDCSDRNVRCEIQNGVQQIIIIVEEEFDAPTQQVRFKVSEGASTAGLEYFLRVSVGR